MDNKLNYSPSFILNRSVPEGKYCYITYESYVLGKCQYINTERETDIVTHKFIEDDDAWFRFRCSKYNEICVKHKLTGYGDTKWKCKKCSQCI